jgi:hypothetical protein
MPSVQAVHTDETYLYMTVDGQAYRVRWSDCSMRLVQATPLQRKRIEVSPSGYGIHWPDVDEDLSVTPLLIHAEKLGSPAHKVTLS